MESGEEIEYGYLVIATGTNAKWPVRLHGMPKEEVLQGYQELAEKVCSVSFLLLLQIKKFFDLKKRYHILYGDGFSLIRTFDELNYKNR